MTFAAESREIFVQCMSELLWGCTLESSVDFPRLAIPCSMNNMHYAVHDQGKNKHPKGSTIRVKGKLVVELGYYYKI